MDKIVQIKGGVIRMIKGFKGPNHTIVQLSVASILSILLLSWLRIRPIGILFVGVLGFWFYKTRCNLQIMASPEIQNNFNTMMARVRDYRQSQPGSFCAVTSLCLLALAILGHVVSGSTVVLIGLITAAIISTKYNIIIVKQAKKENLWPSRRPQDLDMDDEFLPEATENNLCVLQRASDLATISSPTEIEADDEEKSDEVPSDFLIEEVPEVNENTSDEDKEVEDLLPLVKKSYSAADATAEKSYQIKNLDISNKEAILFKKRHFKDDNSSLIDTSSSSDESLSKGLVFPDHTEIDAPFDSSRAIQGSNSSQPHNLEASDIIATAVKAQTQAFLANSGKILPTLVSSLVQWGSGGPSGDGAGAGGGPSLQKPPPSNRRVVTSLDSSDDSDFEILENDDFH